MGTLRSRHSDSRPERKVGLHGEHTLHAALSCGTCCAKWFKGSMRVVPRSLRSFAPEVMSKRGFRGFFDKSARKSHLQELLV